LKKILLEQLHQARQTNLPQYLMSRGEKLKRNGRRYRHADHESLVFTSNAYYWNARNEKGNAIDLLVRYYGMDFETAVKELINHTSQAVTAALIGAAVTAEPTEKSADPSAFSFSDIVLCTDMRRAIAYLNKTRGIDYGVIQELIGKKLIYQEAETNNIVFPIYDENDQIVGAETVGSLSNSRYKGIKAGRKYGYGFNIAIDKPLRYALFFESAIDLISFMELKRTEGKPLTGCLLVSMAGVKENIVEHTLTAFKGVFEPLEAVLCVDRDTAGVNFVKAVERKIKGVRTLTVNAPHKDWNEQLKAR